MLPEGIRCHVNFAVSTNIGTGILVAVFSRSRRFLECHFRREFKELRWPEFFFEAKRPFCERENRTRPLFTCLQFAFVSDAPDTDNVIWRYRLLVAPGTMATESLLRSNECSHHYNQERCLH